MAGGRPTTYDPAYCDKVVELGRQGMSVIEMCAELSLGRTTLERDWPSAHPEFSQAFTHAMELSQAWWETQGRTNLTADRFQASLYSRSMAARFPADWREVKGTELTGKDGAPIQTTQRIERVIVDPTDTDPA